MARGYSDIRPALFAGAQTPRGENVASAGYQSEVMDAVRHGDFVPLDFVEVTAKHPTIPDLTARFLMNAHALKIGTPGDSSRPALTHRSQQAIADLLGLLVPTADLLDRMVETFGVVAEPIPTPNIATMMHLDQVELHSAKLDQTGSPWDNTKSWINSLRLANPGSLLHGKDTGINYLWATMGKPVPEGVPGPKPAETSTGFRVLQQPGARHIAEEADRSQMGIGFVQPVALLRQGGIEISMPVQQIALDPVLYPLVSRAGPMVLHHPWIPQCTSIAEGGDCPFLPPSATPATPLAPRSGSRGVVAAGAVLLALTLLWYLSREGKHG